MSNRILKSGLSLFMAFIILMMLITVPAVAESKQHTATITVNTTEANEGDEVIVTVKIDSIENLVALQYDLSFDSNVFDIDTTLMGEGATKYPAYIDEAWFEDVTEGNITLWSYLGKPYINAVPGIIRIVAATGYKVSEKENDNIIGKFILKVKDSAKAGDTPITLIRAQTGDGNELLATEMLSSPISLTINGTNPSTPTVKNGISAIQFAGGDTLASATAIESVSIYDTSATDGVLIVALYDENNILLDAKATPVTVEDYNNNTASLNISLTKPSNAAKAKVLFWSNQNNDKPIYELVCK